MHVTFVDILLATSIVQSVTMAIFLLLPGNASLLSNRLLAITVLSFAAGLSRVLPVRHRARGAAPEPRLPRHAVRPVAGGHPVPVRQVADVPGFQAAQGACDPLAAVLDRPRHLPRRVPPATAGREAQDPAAARPPGGAGVAVDGGGDSPGLSRLPLRDDPLDQSLRRDVRRIFSDIENKQLAWLRSLLVATRSSGRSACSIACPPTCSRAMSGAEWVVEHRCRHRVRIHQLPAGQRPATTDPVLGTEHAGSGAAGRRGRARHRTVRRQRIHRPARAAHARRPAISSIPT